MLCKLIPGPRLGDSFVLLIKLTPLWHVTSQHLLGPTVCHGCTGEPHMGSGLPKANSPGKAPQAFTICSYPIAPSSLWKVPWLLFSLVLPFYFLLSLSYRLLLPKSTYWAMSSPRWSLHSACPLLFPALVSGNCLYSERVNKWMKTWRDQYMKHNVNVCLVLVHDLLEPTSFTCNFSLADYFCV